MCFADLPAHRAQLEYTRTAIFPRRMEFDPAGAVKYPSPVSWQGDDDRSSARACRSRGETPPSATVPYVRVALPKTSAFRQCIIVRTVREAAALLAGWD